MVQKKKPFEEERKLNNNLGVMHQRLGQHTEAQEYLTKAIEKQDGPTSSAQEFGLNFNMAMTMMKINNLDSAEKYLKKSLEVLDNNDGSFKAEL